MMKAENPFAAGPVLQREIEASGYVHRPLPLHPELSLEARIRAKPALKRRRIWDGEDLRNWSGEGPGTLSHDGIPTAEGHRSLRITLPTRSDAWPAEAADGDYTPFARYCVRLALPRENWEEYNRISFSIYPDCPGARIITLALIFTNEGAVPVPDQYRREGHHELNLENRKWNTIALEFPSLPRDAITMVGFECPAFGRDYTGGEYLCYQIGEIDIEAVAEPENARGWIPNANTIAYSHPGYAAEGKKTALLRAAPGEPPAFSLHDAGGKTVLNGAAGRISALGGELDILDFSDITAPGVYTLQCGNITTPPFRIGSGIWADSLWKALNFIFCERCGYPIPEKHSGCHGDIIAEHNGLRLVYSGGWHDAGDLSQQTLQTGDVVYNLLELANSARGQDGGLYWRLIEEAEWGLDFILKCRFGDGYRASSAGLVDWTDGLIGNMDDRPARVHNNAFDNFLYAAYTAYAALTLTHDPMRCEGLARIAREDFAFAMDVYHEKGFNEKPVFWEHSYATSPSQYMATLSWSASMLYKLTGLDEYAREAADAIGYVLDCQRIKGIGKKNIVGFFYRDKNCRVIQHFNHQSRDQVYMQALDLLLETQGNHAESGVWKKAMERYAAYLKQISTLTEPYGMLPGGIYHVDEWTDEESFERQHRFPGENAAEEYAAQLRAGIKLDDEHYAKIFPVWFSFRGNTAVHLATGKAAAICGRRLGDRELLDICREQLYWLAGKNPFCQSLMYGEGHDYPEQAVFLPGTMTGQLPVGIETRDNEDVPYWPQANNATYKEAWLTCAGKWISLAAEIIEADYD